MIVAVGLSDTSYFGWGGAKIPTYLLTGNRQSDHIWCANSLRHVLSENVKINLKLAVIFAHVSIFLCVVKKSGKIGQNQEKIKFGAQFPPKHDNYDRIHQITLHYKRNLQTIQIVLLFS